MPSSPPVRSPSAILVPLLLGPWLVAKQLVWAPPLGVGQPRGAGAGLAALAVALVVLGVALRLRGRAQLLALAALDLLLTLAHQIQLLYARQFSELASVAALGFASQVAGVRGAVLALFRPTDALLWVDLVALAVLAAARVPRPRPRRRLANVLLALGLLLVVPPAWPLVHRPLAGPRRLAVSRAEVASSLGVIGYQLYDAATYVRGRLERTGHRSLPEALAYHRARAAPHGPLTGSERGRNVIVVHLESTSAFAVGMHVGGAPVTPVLDRLARESLAFSRAHTQAGQGTSADAELGIDCSLYALETGAVFTESYDRQFRCLPEVLREQGYATVAMHANWPNFWNRERMYPAMGYQRFLSIRDFDRAPVIGLGLSDARFFEQAVERLAATPQPFYAHLVMLSNHAPFDDPAIPRALPLGALEGTYVGRYLDSVHLEDAAVGVLLDRLRAAGLLDRSVLVLYGDHGGVQRSADGVELLGLDERREDVWLDFETRVPLLIRLPGGASAAARGDPAGQVDVAPTLADLLGIPLQGTFFHGRSLVSDPPVPVVMPEGSAITGDLVYLSPEGRWGRPGCVDAASGRLTAPERCAALAPHAARELAISRAEVNEDLFRWMAASAGDGVRRR